jgi:hypothetical protein
VCCAFTTMAGMLGAMRCGRAQLLLLSVLLGTAGCEQPAAPPPEVALAVPFPGEAEQASPDEVEIPQGPRAVITAQMGKVELLVAGSANWTPAAVGDEVAVEDAIRTFDDSEVEITLNEVTIRVAERSELGVTGLSDTAVRARLRGRAETRVTQGKGEVEIAGQGTDALMRSEGGTVAVSASGRGVVAVATLTGSATLVARDRTVRVKAGQVSHAGPGRGPREPKQALRQVLLSVKWPPAKVTSRRQLPVSGQVEPGSRVRIQGEDIPVDAEGRFVAEVPLARGQQTVAVATVDVLGRRKEARRRIEVDDRKPHLEIKEKPW